MFSVYILESQHNRLYYVGSCTDLAKRLDLHNRAAVKSTKRYRPWKIVYVEKYATLSEARKREMQIKSWKSRFAVQRLIKTFQNINIEDPR